MSGTEATSTIAIEELIEPQVIFPVWIEVQLVIPIIDCSSSVVVANKEVLKSVLQIFSHVAEMHIIA